MDIKRLERVDSTNTWLVQHEHELSAPIMVCCKEQLAGRGQRGNHWESEPGKNLTASVLFRPADFPASRQFSISEAVALSIVAFLEEKGVKAKVKWPNDIYVDNRKICGILVEHAVTGRNITRTVAGFGLNLNQTVFISDAPNPVSLKILTGEDSDIQQDSESIASILEEYFERLETPEELHALFLEKLWRGDGGFYKFKDLKRGETIEAKIKSVGYDGMLTLQTREGEKREYAFKEVEFTLK